MKSAQMKRFHTLLFEKSSKIVYKIFSNQVDLAISSHQSNTNMSDHDHSKSLPGADVPDNAQDLTIFVQNLLEQMVCKNFWRHALFDHSYE